MTKPVGILLAALLTVGCERITVITPPTAPTATPTAPAAPAADLVEFRVDGDLPLVIVKTANTLDGLAQTSTVLPFSSVVSVAGQASVFVSLDARASTLGAYGFLHAAIFVNGVLFREASAAGLNPVVSVSGTWRRR